MISKEILDRIEKERHRQNLKFGEQNHSDEWWIAILGEEFGEVCQAVLHDEFGGKAQGTTETELFEVVAVGIQWLELIERRRNTQTTGFKTINLDASEEEVLTVV